MSEKSTVRMLRERGVKPSERVKEMVREQRKITKMIREALKEGAKTIPEIASQTELPKPTVTWFLMTMRKYGEVTEEGEEGEYYRYRLTEVERDE